jgi:Protein of unknown function (DUF3300)/Chaperone of endosialidase
MLAWSSRLMMVTTVWCALLAATAQTPTTAQTPGTTQTTTAAPEQPLLKPEELDALVAPIALHPDPLLSQILIASTYPLEVVQAERWATQNKNLKSDQFKTEADKQAWDDSLKALVATPSVLTMMSTKLEWTQKLGDAVLAQQSDVMDAVQRLRSRAQKNNKLTTTKEQKVTVTQQQGKQVIAIDPAVPDTIHVPYYDPAVVYGGWPNPEYPPYYFGYPGYIAAGVVAGGIAFGAGWALGRWTAGGGSWGGGINWNNNNINIGSGNRVTHWQHNSLHRHGVKYNNAAVRQQFARTDAEAGKAREAFRGKEGSGGAAGDRGRPGGGDRAAAGDRGRPGGGDRAGAGDRGRPGAGDRPGGSKDRPQARNGGGRGDAGRGGGGNRASSRPASRPSSAAPRRDTAFSNMNQGARAHANRGRQSMQGMGGPRFAGGGGASFGGGGGMRGGGGFGGGRGGGRRSDIAVKRDITLLGHLGNGLGFYRFSYVDSDRVYVGVMAQEVQTIMPEAVMRGQDGYLTVSYERLGLKFQTYDRWLTSGARLPVAGRH